jgi:hypothetical protein
MMDKWYNAKTEHPKDNGRYLCVKKYNDYRSCGIYEWAKCLAYVDNYDFEGMMHPGWYSYDSEYGYYEIDNVTHWMPLPELPKK